MCVVHECVRVVRVVQVNHRSWPRPQISGVEKELIGCVHG